MKILFVNKFYHPSGGPEKVILQYKDKLESLGDKVIPFSMNHPRNLETPYSRYFVSNVDYNSTNSFWNKARMAVNIFYSVEAKKKIEHLINKEKPDLAHLHNIYHQISPSILPALKKKGIPVVMTLHDFKLICPNYTFLRDGKPCEKCEGKHFYKAVIHRCVKNSFWKSLTCSLEMYFHRALRIYRDSVDIFITLSQFSKSKMIRYGIPEKKLMLLPNYINLPSNGSGEKLGKYILFIGRLSEKNGIFTLIQAMERTRELPLVVAGEGELLPNLKRYVREKKLENVKFVGFLENEKLEPIIKNCLFMVFPAICYHNCPMSILESFALSKPVIGSNLGSIPELIQDGVNGLLFEPQNVDNLSEKIKYLYHHPLLAHKMGISARKKIEEQYSEVNYYNKLFNLYKSLLKQGG